MLNTKPTNVLTAEVIVDFSQRVASHVFIIYLFIYLLLI